MPREIITLQLGELANFTGAHFWNLQARGAAAAARAAPSCFPRRPAGPSHPTLPPSHLHARPHAPNAG